MSTFNVNLHETIYSLSDALDMVGVTHIHHGKRVAYIAAECGKYLGWQGERLDDLFQAAILHDCGVSTTRVHARLLQFEWEHENNHCTLGARLLENTPLLRHLADPVRYHHTHWLKLKETDLPEATQLAANCIFMADRVDVLTLAALVDQSNVLLGRETIRQKILEKSGDWFCPELVDAFIRVSKSEAFWFSLESEHVNGYTSTWIAHDQTRTMAFSELRSLVHLFSYIVDAKSPFTREHSDGVARLSRFIGQQFGLAEESCEMLELAGLLHDIGKLRVPDDLLEKPGKLTPDEYATVQRHSFDTYAILRNIKGLEKITQWAAQHHERVDGSGYPYHVGEDRISLEARIVAVADVFQALAQNRPYRGPLSPEAILAILQRQRDEGHLDGAVVACVEQHLHACWRAAVEKDSPEINESSPQP